MTENTKTNGISSGLVAVAWMNKRNGFIAKEGGRDYQEQLVRLSDAEALIAEKDAEIERLAAKVNELEIECSDLESERDDAEHQPWPEWAETILKIVRKHSGYDGFADDDGIDLPRELSELLSEITARVERLTRERDKWETRAREMLREDIRAKADEIEKEAGL